MKKTATPKTRPAPKTTSASKEKTARAPAHKATAAQSVKPAETTKTQPPKPAAPRPKPAVQIKEASAKPVGIKKIYPKNKTGCTVTFKLPKAAAPEAKQIFIVGDFNNWDTNAAKMKKLKNGDHTIAIQLEPGRQYQYKYLIDNQTWENDWHADTYVKSPFGDTDNSVVFV
ncbi:MAG: hypothetical protein GY868_02865 [Deltaproteobacteria bacterium]|nr:hypothetical protein [Deltaproteobacteria bacterium]